MADAYGLLLSGFGVVLLFLGLAGSILPVLPGPFLIWLGAFLWAWGNDFERVDGRCWSCWALWRWRRGRRTSF